MKSWLLFTFFTSVCCFAQDVKSKQDLILIDKSAPNKISVARSNQDSLPIKEEKSLKSSDSIATISMYSIRNWKGLETKADTSLTIQKYYSVNPIHKDLFGLLASSNDGLAYTTLDYSKHNLQSLPQMGFAAKSVYYKSVKDINYYHVATPMSELKYRSAINQGQNLNALIAVNTSKYFNFFIGYNGLRSEGTYINTQSSIGNLQIGASYNSKNKKYNLKTHFTSQDISNRENGGITDRNLFESKEGVFSDRSRLNVFYRDAGNILEGLRFFLEHEYRFVSSDKQAFLLKHQFIGEEKSNVFSQENSNPENFYYAAENQLPLERDRINRFYGASYSTLIKDTVNHHTLYNELSLAFTSKKLGSLSFGVDYFNYGQSYKSVVVTESSGVIPSKYSGNIASLKGTYFLNKKGFNATFTARQSIMGGSISELHATLEAEPFKDYILKANYQFVSKMPDIDKQFFQSSYTNYNWLNQFNNEKISKIDATLKSPWVTLSGEYQMIVDKIYYKNTNLALDYKGRLRQILVRPMQFKGMINYFKLRLDKEFKFGKFALDNSLLIQKSIQSEQIVNVPLFTTRNTFYYSDYLFSKALFLQTGFGFNFFSSYHADAYNMVLSDFYVQTQQKIGGYPMFDFFLNAKIRTARVFFKVEHFNALIGNNKYYSAPGYPFQEMSIRFGIIWDFFS